MDIIKQCKIVNVTGRIADLRKSGHDIVTKIEHGEQVALVAWCMANRSKHPAFDMIFANENAGKRSKWDGARKRDAGMRRGIPDLFMAWPQSGSMWPHGGGAHGLFIEMKSETGKISPEQAEWIKKLQEAGYRATVCWSFEEAAETICGYLGLDARRCGL